MRSLPRSIQIMLLVLTVLLALYPLFGEALAGSKHDYVTQKVTTIMILAIMALSLDLLVGVGAWSALHRLSSLASPATPWH